MPGPLPDLLVGDCEAQRSRGDARDAGRGRALFLVFVGTWQVSLQVTMLPNYVMLARLQRLNTLAALVVPQLAAAFAIILLRQHMLGFPRDLLDASSWRTLWTIVVPSLRAPPRPALAILVPARTART